LSDKPHSVIQVYAGEATKRSNQQLPTNVALEFARNKRGLDRLICCASALARRQHSNVLQIHGVYEGKMPGTTNVAIVIERPQASLWQQLYRGHGGSTETLAFSQFERARLFHQLATAMLALQEHRLAYPCISSKDVFVCRDAQGKGVYKLGGFGSSVSSDISSDTGVIIPMMAAPEMVARKGRWGEAACMSWTLGMLLWEVTAGVPPLHLATRAGYLRHLEGRCGAYGVSLPAPATDGRTALCLASLLHRDPERRMGLPACREQMAAQLADLSGPAVQRAGQLQACELEARPPKPQEEALEGVSEDAWVRAVELVVARGHERKDLVPSFRWLNEEVKDSLRTESAPTNCSSPPLKRFSRLAAMDSLRWESCSTASSLTATMCEVRPCPTTSLPVTIAAFAI
jgi:hypothetical protein